MTTPLTLLRQLPPRTRTVIAGLLTAVRLRAPLGERPEGLRAEESKAAARAAALADAASFGPRPEAAEDRPALAEQAA
ncbi:hypothetical protein [Streptomyces sp. S.PB5]|uniref:hypothetical protein n=1 Tax=Streptomyces sp. S.PB5 TaxID=3020844 RepID=UPI0025B171D7|nr:hypothetical protein [Streptomyces sp. S.PB5]MDN3027263.1 hypothetical protein [Streptomyces sp. S.PB5]